MIEIVDAHGHDAEEFVADQRRAALDAGDTREANEWLLIGVAIVNSPPVCPECRRGELKATGDRRFPGSVECPNCDRWWTTVPPTANTTTPIPGSHLCRVRDAARR